MRGFESSGFGPRDSVTGDALGGNIFVAGTAEVQFPVPILPRELGFKGAFFADAGTLFDTDATVDVGIAVSTAPTSAPRSAARSSGHRRLGRSAPTSPT